MIITLPMFLMLLIAIMSSYVITSYLFITNADNLFILDAHLLVGLDLGLLLASTFILMFAIGNHLFMIDILFMILIILNIYCLIIAYFGLSKKIVKRESVTLVSAYRNAIFIGLALSFSLVFFGMLFG